jgi:hypothetical protein
MRANKPYNTETDGIISPKPRKRRRKSKTANPLAILIPAMLATIISSCTIEDIPNTYNPNPEGEQTVTFSLKLPNNSTRSLTLADENDLQDVKVLIFSESGVLKYATEASAAGSEDITVKAYSAKVAPTEGNEKVDIMILANAGTVVRNKYPNGIPLDQGLTRDDLAQAFTIERGSGWVSDKNNASYTPIPMWGWTKGATIHPENGLDAAHSTIGLSRMMAKINLAIRDKARTTFKLSAVYMMNRNTVGRVIPNITAEEPWTGLSPRAVSPSLPTETKPKMGAGNGLMYGDSYLNDPSEPYEMNGVIYSFEATKGVPYSESNKAAYEESPCLIIAGRFQGDPATTTYYRVDFYKTGSDGSQQFLHLLRNYFYDVSISNIDGPGYPSIEDALRNRPLHIIGEVVPWIDSDMPIQVTDGIRVLSVDKELIQFDASGAPDSIKIYTDMPNGWRINVSELPSWLHFIRPSANDNVVRGETLKFIQTVIKPDELASTAQPREATFTVEAGALKKSISIRQSNETRMSLTISPNTLIFPLSAPSSKTVTVTSVPANALRMISYTVTGTLKFLPGKGPEDYNNTAATSFEIQPTPGTSGTAVVVIRINNEAGQTATQVLYIVQLATDLEFGFIGVPSAGYEATDQGPKTIQIVSEIPWRLSMDKNPSNAPLAGNMITITDNTEHPANAGILEDYTFTLAQNPGYTERIAYFGVNSSLPNWNYFTFPVLQKGTPPEIKIIAPESKMHDFSENPEPLTVQFSTNADWKMTPDNNFLNIVASIIPSFEPAGKGPDIALNKVTRTITFKPVSADSLPAGSAINSLIKFETYNHPGAVAHMDILSLSLTVPPRYGAISYQYNKAISDTLSITAWTNAEWQIRSNPKLIDTIVPAQPYGAHTVKVRIPSTDVFEETTYYFSSWFTATPNATRDTSIYKEAATLVYDGHSAHPDTIAAEGIELETSDLYLNFSGTYKGDYNIRVIRNFLSPGTVLTGRGMSRRVSIRPTEQWGDRAITFEYQKGWTYETAFDGTTWATPKYIAIPSEGLPSAKFTQRGYYIKGYTQTTTLTAIGGLSNEIISGFFPRMYVHAEYSDHSPSSVPIRIGPGSSAVADVRVSANNSWENSRTISYYAVDSSQTPAKKVLLSEMQQGHYSISPTSKTYGTLSYLSRNDIAVTFNGVFPKLIVESNNEGAVPTIDEIGPGTIITLNVDVYTNTGPDRELVVYLKDMAEGKVRATFIIPQEGTGQYYIWGPSTPDSKYPTETQLKTAMVVDPTDADDDVVNGRWLASMLHAYDSSTEGGWLFYFATAMPNGSIKFVYLRRESNGTWVLEPHEGETGPGQTIPSYYVLLKTK